MQMSDILLYLSFSVWLTWFSMIISRSTHVAANAIYSFFFENGWVTFHCITTLYSYTTSFFHSFVCGSLGCFFLLVIKNSVSMNIGMIVCFPIRVFLSRYMPRSGIAGSYGKSQRGTFIGLLARIQMHAL